MKTSPTGRMTESKPNMQCISPKTEEARIIKEALLGTTTGPAIKILVHLPTLQAILPGSPISFKAAGFTVHGHLVGLGAEPGTVKVYAMGTEPEGDPEDLNAQWMTDDEYVKALVADGSPEDVAEDIVAEIIAALTKKPY